MHFRWTWMDFKAHKMGTIFCSLDFLYFVFVSTSPTTITIILADKPWGIILASHGFSIVSKCIPWSKVAAPCHGHIHFIAGLSMGPVGVVPGTSIAPLPSSWHSACSDPDKAGCDPCHKVIGFQVLYWGEVSIVMGATGGPGSCPGQPNCQGVVVLYVKVAVAASRIWMPGVLMGRKRTPARSTGL